MKLAFTGSNSLAFGVDVQLERTTGRGADMVAGLLRKGPALHAMLAYGICTT